MLFVLKPPIRVPKKQVVALFPALTVCRKKRPATIGGSLCGE